MNPAVIDQCRAEIAAFLAACPELDEDATLRADMLEGETDMAAVLSRIVRARNFARADQAGAKAAKQDAAARYDRRIEIAERAEATCARMLLAILDAAQLTRFAVPEGKISVIAPKQRLELAADFTPPQGYQRIKIEADKAAIKAALEAGEAMPGAALVAGEPSVRIV